MTFHSDKPVRPQMPERTRRVAPYSQGNASLPYHRNRLGSAGTDQSIETLWDHATGRQIPQRGLLDHLSYFNVDSSQSTISKSQFSINDGNGKYGIKLTSSMRSTNDHTAHEFEISQHTGPNDGFISYSSPESATWQPGEVFTPSSSYMGSQCDDSLLPDVQPRSYGSFDSMTSSNPETLASGCFDNFVVLDTSPTCGSPLSNERLTDDLKMPIGYFEKSYGSSPSFAYEACETSMGVSPEAGNMTEPVSCDPFDDLTTGGIWNWMLNDPVQPQLCITEEPSEAAYDAYLPWSSERPKHGFAVNAGNGAFQPKPGYPYEVFKSREGILRSSDPGRPYFGPQSSYLVRENNYDQKQSLHENEMVPRDNGSETPQKPLNIHQHVFSFRNEAQKLDNHRGRTGKLTPEERERTLEVRKDGACWPCHLLKTRCSPCSSGSPCEQCARLAGKRRFCWLPCFNDTIESLHAFIIPDCLFGHFNPSNVEAFIGKHAIEWGTKNFPMQMSWGCKKLIHVNVVTLSLMGDSSELAYNHQAITNEDGSVELVRNKCPPLGLNMADLDDMKKRYREHVEDVVENDLPHYVLIAYDDQSSKLPERLLGAVCLWHQRGISDRNEHVLLRQAIEVHVASTILERSLIPDKACMSNIQAHLGKEYPVLSAPRGAQRQIKLAIFMEQRFRIQRVLEQWGKLMRNASRAEKNWPTAFCVFLMLILTMDKTITAAQYFYEGRIKFRGRDRKSEWASFENLRRLMETNLFERCKEIFHCRYKTRKGGNERCNPVRDGTAAWRGDAVEDRTARLIDDVQQVIQDFVPNTTSVEQRPVQTGQVMYTDLGRLAKIFLGDF